MENMNEQNINKSTIGDKIYKLRKDKGINQETLAEALNVTRQSVSRWESNANIPEMNKIIEIAKYFDIPVSSILDNNNASDMQINTAEINETLSSYTAEINKTLARHNKKNNAVLISLSAIILAMCFIFSTLTSNIKNECENMQITYDSRYMAMQSQINALNNEIASLTKTDSLLFYANTYKLQNYNFKENTVDIAFSMGLRSYSQSSQVVVSIISGTELIQEELLIYNGVVSGEVVTVPLSDKIEITATVINGEARQNEVLPPILNAEKATQLSVETLGVLDMSRIRKDENYDPEVGIVNQMESANEIRILYPDNANLELKAENIRMYLNINGKYETDFEVVTMEEYIKIKGLNTEEYTRDTTDAYSSLEKEFTIREGDVLEFNTEITDNYGRTYIVYTATYNVYTTDENASSAYLTIKRQY